MSGFRGNGGVEEADKEALLALVRRKGYYSLDTARQRLGMTANQIHAAAAALRREGRLDPAGGEALRLPGERPPRERPLPRAVESRERNFFPPILQLCYKAKKRLLFVRRFAKMRTWNSAARGGSRYRYGIG